MPDTIEITKAVKEALDDKRMEEISHQITDLATQMTQGFAEVHTRQDVANGRTSKNEQNIEIMKIRAGSTVLYTNALWFLVTVLVGVVTFLISHK